MFLCQLAQTGFQLLRFGVFGARLRFGRRFVHALLTMPGALQRCRAF
jgi:hypothetical protein